MTSTPQWYVRPFQTEDQEQFLGLLAGWITDVSVKDHYQWLYQGNPHGEAVVWLAIERNTGKLIGCTSCFPKQIWVSDHIVTGSTGGDSYVDPEWRRKGIAEALHSALYKDRQQRGLHIDYGFALPENRNAMCKSGVQVVGNFLRARFLLSSIPVLRKTKLQDPLSKKLFELINSLYVKNLIRKYSRPSDSHYVIEETDRFDNSFENLIQEITPSFGICCLRDVPYLLWRYTNNPLKEYTVLSIRSKPDKKLYGFAVLEVSENNLSLTDIFVCKEDTVVDCLLRATILYGIGNSFHRITITANPLGPYSNNLVRCGFKFSQSSQYPLLLWSDNPTPFLKDLKNWHLTSGDLDI